MYEALLFDLDDTLLDFKAAEAYAFKQLMSELKIRYSEQLFAQYDEINQRLWRQLEQQEITKQYLLNNRFGRFFKELGYEDLDSIAADKRLRELLADNAILMPNAKSTLATLKERGCKLYTASNGVYETQMRRMKAAGILDFFDGHFISESVGYEKPNAKFFDYILKDLKVNPWDLLMIGDGLNSDIKGANNSGIDCVFYNPKRVKVTEETTFTIKDLNELLPLV